MATSPSKRTGASGSVGIDGRAGPSLILGKDDRPPQRRVVVSPAGLSRLPVRGAVWIVPIDMSTVLAVE
jgi:hypothetical protein